MKSRSWWTLLLLPLLGFTLTCATNATQPEPEPAFAAQQAGPPPREADEVFIVVEVDKAAGTAVPSPDPAFATVRQKVTWISTDPAYTIEVFWKNPGNGPARPCPAPARRCGGRPVGAPANSRLEYGIRAYEGTTKVAEQDPILEILP